MDLGLRDRVYLVTGGSRGLGYAAAEALVADGARVVVSARDAAGHDEGGRGPRSRRGRWGWLPTTPTPPPPAG